MKFLVNLNIPTYELLETELYSDFEVYLHILE